MASDTKPPVPYAGLLAAMSYSVFSIAITLFNKAVLSTYHFDATMTLTLGQGLVTIIALEFMKRRGYISYPDFSLQTAIAALPLSLVFVAYVVISLISLGRVNVPMFTALRRLTIIFVMIEEYYYFGTVPSRQVLYSVVTMTIGAAIAAWRDLTFDPVSYFYLFLTNLFTSLYTVYINVVKKATNLNVWGLLFYNTVTTLPLLVILAVVTGDLSSALAFKHYSDLYFEVSFQASLVLAFLMNVSTFYCTTLNTARTQTVVGQIKNFVAFLLGLVLFNDYIYDPYNFVGLLIGFAGGVQYSWVTYTEKLEKDAAKTPKTDTGASAGVLSQGATLTGSGSSNNLGDGPDKVGVGGGLSPKRLSEDGGGGDGGHTIADATERGSLRERHHDD